MCKQLLKKLYINCNGTSHFLEAKQQSQAMTRVGNSFDAYRRCNGCMQSNFGLKVRCKLPKLTVNQSDIVDHNITNLRLYCYFRGFYFHFTGGKYLIAGGCFDGSSTDHKNCIPTEMTEVVDFAKTNSAPSFGQLPARRQGAVGAMIGNAPLLCGGCVEFIDGPYFDSCISYQNSQWSQSHSMNKKRAFPAVVQINSTTLWILGGSEQYSSNTDFASDTTEFIIKGQTNGVPGPKLPYGLYKMCAVKLSEEEIFVIGGYSVGNEIRNEVWIYNPHNGFSRNQGPSLNTRRGDLSCSTMTDGETTFIIVAGGYNLPDYLSSVEIYSPIDKEWYSGKKNPNHRKLYLFIVFKPK